MRRVAVVRLDDLADPDSDVKTAKPVPDIDDSGDIPDQEVENQTKFIKALEEYGATPDLLVMGFESGFFSTESLKVLIANENYKAVTSTEALEDANLTLKEKLKAKWAAVVAKFNDFKSKSLDKLKSLKATQWVAKNPKKAAAAVAGIGILIGFLAHMASVVGQPATYEVDEQGNAAKLNILKRQFEDVKTRVEGLKKKAEATSVVAAVTGKQGIGPNKTIDMVPKKHYSIRNGRLHERVDKESFVMDDESRGDKLSNLIVKAYLWTVKLQDAMGTYVGKHMDPIRRTNVDGVTKLKSAYAIGKLYFVIGMLSWSVAFLISLVGWGFHAVNKRKEAREPTPEETPTEHENEEN